jgi:clathrin heavy chain
MESDRFVCVKDTDAGGNSQVVMVDMHNGNAVSTKPMKAEAALMNPRDNVIALKAANDGGAGVNIQVFDFDSKAKLGSHTMTENVVHWKWLSPRMLALVTDTQVHHWNLEGQAAPTVAFQRIGQLAQANTQIIGYTSISTATGMTWCLLNGIYQDANKAIAGAMQLYCVEKGQQQMLEGHAGAFGNVVVFDGSPSASLFAFAERKAASPDVTKLNVFDVGWKEGQGQKFRVQKDIPMSPEAPGDFAITMVISEKYGVVYMITQKGVLVSLRLRDRHNAVPLPDQPGHGFHRRPLSAHGRHAAREQKRSRHERERERAEHRQIHHVECGNLSWFAGRTECVRHRLHPCKETRTSRC